MKHGATVAAFEREFASFVGARHAIALCNGTATLHTALVALGVKRGDRVAVPPLTMASTTIAVLHAGAVPLFCDVDERMWLMRLPPAGVQVCVPVSLYGLSGLWQGSGVIDDAAQTLKRHDGRTALTSYSFQASKILSTGEGGMLTTDDEELATRARAFSSLGYRMRADQPRIDPDALKSPTFDRHYSLGFNYRMNDLTAAEGLKQLEFVDDLLTERASSAQCYERAHAGCDWITPQYVPPGWTFDAWTYAFAVKSVDLWHPLVTAMVRHGAEMPYACWRITYQEPAFRHLAPDGTCPIAEDLQPRIVQCQTNNLQSAEKNAAALRKAIREVGGSR